MAGAFRRSCLILPLAHPIVNFPGFNLLTCPNRVWFNIRIPKPGFRGSPVSCTDPVVHSVVATTWHRVPPLSSPDSMVLVVCVCVCVSSCTSSKLHTTSFSTAVPAHGLVPLSSSFAMLWMNRLSFLSLQISPCHYYLFVTPVSRHRWHPFTASKNFVPCHGRLSQNKTKNMSKRLSPLTRVHCEQKIFIPVTDV